MKTLKNIETIKDKYLSDLNLKLFSLVRNHGSLNEYNGHAKITGECGDTMEYWLLIRDGKIEHVSFVTDGCGYSQACGSMAASMIEGVEVQEAATLEQQEILDLLPGLPPDHEHCARLAAKTIKAACRSYEECQKEAAK
ncbi:iron-sulfur cluster assembly scaffold protein [bacterium]|nr:iron-sulfur cluster assembly scaffold protein [bacterium]MBU1636991.1 iron-sulfur cluster assembly scaffold protein [bacterium]MBU1921181.1 iron-sulfur cluster assembly scaffold protein [bacterium]